MVDFSADTVLQEHLAAGEKRQKKKLKNQPLKGKKGEEGAAP
jgi:hypothetical protein